MVQQVPGQRCQFVDPKTKAGCRTIRLGTGTLELLRQYHQAQIFPKMLAGGSWQQDFDLIFPSKVGTPINSSNLGLEFNQVLKRAGLPKIRFHDLLHTAALLMLNRGISIIVVSKILGHSKPHVTLDIYGHLYQEMQSEAAMLMDNLVMPAKIEKKGFGTLQAEAGGVVNSQGKLHQSTPTGIDPHRLELIPPQVGV